MSEINGLYIEDDILYKYTGRKRTLIVPSKIKIIGKCAFECNKHIEKVVLARQRNYD